MLLLHLKHWHKREILEICWFFTFLTGLLILTFYAVVIGWIFNYIVMSVTALPASFKESEDVFMSFLKEDIYTQFILLH